MRILYLLIAIFISSPVVLAAPDNVITGPYNISFDIEIPHDEYDVIAAEPIESESLGGNKNINYNITIQSKKDEATVAFIGLIYYLDRENDQPENADQMRRATEETVLKLHLRNPEIATREMDRTLAGVASGDLVSSRKIYYAFYLPTVDPTHLACYILSSYPWDEGTLQLLKTIHIEKAI